MARLRFWERRVKKYNCGGNIRLVYSDFNDVFPLHIAEYQEKTAGAIKAAEQITVSASNEHKETAKALLFKITQTNQSQQTHLRAAYAVYGSAPCEALQVFIDAVKEAREFEARLNRADLIMQYVLNLLSKPAAARMLDPAARNGEDPVNKLLMSALQAIVAPSYMGNVVKELEAVPNQTREWQS